MASLSTVDSLILIILITYEFHFFHVFFFLFLSRPTRLQDSDGEKSDQDLVVDIANETVSFKELVKQSKHSRCTMHHLKNLKSSRRDS